MEKGLNCLSDFILILDHKKPEMEEKTYFKMKSHALYYIGIIYLLKGNKTESEKYLRDVYHDILEMDSLEPKQNKKNWKSEKVMKIEKILAEFF